MKKIITIFITTLIIFSLVGCSSDKVDRDPVLSESLTKVLDKIYERADLDEEFRASLKHYETVELNKENIQGYIGDIDFKFAEGICSAPMMSSIPYELVLLKLDDNADVDKVKATIKENANPRKWVCVEAEEVIVESIDNTVLFLMANKTEASPIKDAFMSLSKVK
ncbi:hypothetical protein [Terrisporobacter glycolicus]|uniref:DUF4358 domain-containing protein n=1 Tax=Terrisporobacter glycolicus ATCC 14880 = DSM 1288 TaxID=1121315 RepID=A0ABZ2ERF6_9FIRM|nr:hypothetical protein [Terrisporobacter glycolicus]